MESRIRILLLSLVAVDDQWLRTCTGSGRGTARSTRQVLPKADADAERGRRDRQCAAAQVIEPQVERRKVKVPKSTPRTSRLACYYGEISIEDFGRNPVGGIDCDYHITEDFFFEATYGASKAGRPVSRP